MNYIERTERKKMPSNVGHVFGIIICLVLLVAALFFAVTGVIGNTSNDVLNLFGYSLYDVQAPSGVPEGSAALVQRNITQFEAQQYYVVQDPVQVERLGVSVRYVERINEDGTLHVYDGQGQDKGDIQTSMVRGKVISYIVAVGGAIGQAQNVYGMILFFVLSCFFFILILLFINKIVQNNRIKKYYRLLQQEEMDEYIEEAESKKRSEARTPYIAEQFEKTAIKTSLDDPTVQMKIAGDETTLELIRKLLLEAAKKRNIETITCDIAYQVPAQLDIECEWKDLALVSTLVSSVVQKLKSE